MLGVKMMIVRTIIYVMASLRNRISLRKCFLGFCFTVLIYTSSCSILPFGSVLFSEKSSQSTQPAGTIYYDDFSSNTSGWDRTETDLGGTNYLNGSYHILINEKNTDYFSTLYRTYTDIGLQVDVQWIEGSYNNNYGLICRYQDEKNFYAGMISSDGYYGIFKIENGEYAVLGHETMMPSEMLMNPEEKKQMVFNCYQNYLFLYVNGNLLDVQQDETFKDGDVGLIAGSFKDAGVHISFDDFYLIDISQNINQDN